LIRIEVITTANAIHINAATKSCVFVKGAAKMKRRSDMGERNLHTVRHFEERMHHVGREILRFYDNAGFWTWYYLTDNEITLAELAHAFHESDLEFIDNLVKKGSLGVYKSLRHIPGNDFNCIYYNDIVFFLEAWAGETEATSIVSGDHRGYVPEWNVPAFGI
jgi:hypothetical protein